MVKKSPEILIGRLEILNGIIYLIMEKVTTLTLLACQGLLESLERTFLGRVLLSMLLFTHSLIRRAKTSAKTST